MRLCCVANGHLLDDRSPPIGYYRIPTTHFVPSSGSIECGSSVSAVSEGKMECHGLLLLCASQ